MKRKNSATLGDGTDLESLATGERKSLPPQRQQPTSLTAAETTEAEWTPPIGAWGKPDWVTYPKRDEIPDGNGKHSYFGHRNLPIDLFRDATSPSGWRLAGHRQKLDPETVHEYARLMRDGVEFKGSDSITVYMFSPSEDATATFWDKDSPRVYWVSDGWHRLEAAVEAGRTRIWADVRYGGWRDAILAACQANTHGNKRNGGDLRAAIETLLDDAEWHSKSDGWRAEQCRTSQQYVSKVHAQWRATHNCCESNRVVQGKDQRTISTGRIGRVAKAQQPSQPDATKPTEPEPEKRDGRDGKVYSVKPKAVKPATAAATAPITATATVTRYTPYEGMSKRDWEERENLRTYLWAGMGCLYGTGTMTVEEQAQRLLRDVPVTGERALDNLPDMQRILAVLQRWVALLEGDEGEVVDAGPAGNATEEWQAVQRAFATFIAGMKAKHPVIFGDGKRDTGPAALAQFYDAMKKLEASLRHGLPTVREVAS